MLILHLSDLHFGDYSRFAGLDAEAAAKEGESFADQVAAACRRLKLKPHPDVVAATGDFAETGHQEELENAGAFLGAAVDRLGVERRRTILVPGNHDVSRGQCIAEEARFGMERRRRLGDVEAESELRQRLDGVKLLPYQSSDAHTAWRSAVRAGRRRKQPRP
jgi:3',5'-cyclic AMP phosphodiesterase CpdA